MSRNVRVNSGFPSSSFSFPSALGFNTFPGLAITTTHRCVCASFAESLASHRRKSSAMAPKPHIHLRAPLTTNHLPSPIKRSKQKGPACFGGLKASIETQRTLKSPTFPYTSSRGTVGIQPSFWLLTSVERQRARAERQQASAILA